MRARRSRVRRQLVELLFGDYRRRILALLLLHPDHGYYLREIERLTGVPAGSLHRELRALADTGLLVRSASGSQVRYQVDRTCPIYEELASIFRKTSGLVDVLREALAPLGAAVRLAFVFGSVAQGKERATSDVDVMVVGSATFEQVVEALVPTSEQLGREVNPVVMAADAFRSKYKSGDRFVSRITREPKLFVIGDAGELRKLANDGRARVTKALP